MHPDDPQTEPLQAAEGATRRTRIVGIGASAGGLESLERMFKSTPSDAGLVFVIVQHLSPDFRSVMDELLRRYTSLPVQLAKNGVEVRPNNIYLMPAGAKMVIRDGRLVLSEKDPLQLALPIDEFFSSLALDAGPDAIAVVLSGTGSDGSRGIRDVERAGGFVIAESAGSAKFDGMPSSARSTGVVDCVCPAEKIGQILVYGPSDENLDTSGEQEVEQDDGQDNGKDDGPLSRLFRLLHKSFGIDFTQYKTNTVARRLMRRVSLSQAESLADYVAALGADSPELGGLYHDLLIGVTEFFRDRDAFAALESKVIPEILRKVPADQEIRVWVAGCATGEEAYSIAILFHEQLCAADRSINLKVLATDVHRASLEHAGRGVYGAQQIAKVTPERRARYFVKRPNGYQISHDLRQLVVFAPHDVTKDAPFTRMHLICCRNMLIYLQPSAQLSVLSRFHFGLASSGTLMLGPSETLASLHSEFDTVDERWKIYRKRRDLRLLNTQHLRPWTGGGVKAVEQMAAAGSRESSGQRLLSTYDQLLDRFMPPSLLIDEDRSLVDCFGGAERLLRVKGRRPSSNVLELLDGDFRTLAAGAIQRVLNRKGRVEYPGLRIPAIDAERPVTMTAEALADARTASVRVLLSFVRETAAQPTGTTVAAAAADAQPAAEATAESGSQSLDLEVLNAELAYTRETLQATIEELETSNEELQATNEELIASNEELQSTNEELHSVNEELYTVNAEHQQKIAELREVNSDIQHMLDGTEIGTLFLDNQLRIRKYTRRIGMAFRIMPQDVGRKIFDLSHGIRRESFVQEVEQVLRDGSTVEDEVRDHQGRLFFLRILPYRPQPDFVDGQVDGQVDEQVGEQEGREPQREPEIEGVVITLTDISALDQMRSRAAQLSAIVESCEDAIVGMDLEGRITSWNSGAQRLYGYGSEEALGRHISFLAPSDRRDEAARFIEQVEAGHRVEHIETTRVCKDGRRVPVFLSISAIRDREGRVVGASAIGRDMSQLREAQREVAEREERIRALLDSTAEAIYGLDLEGRCTFCNPSCVRLLGYSSPDEVVGAKMHELVHYCTPEGDELPLDQCQIHQASREGRGVHGDDEWFCRADGSRFPVEYWSYPIRRDGKIVGAVVTFLDITERRRVEEEIRSAARRREQFLAMLSHELRNPLSAVLNASGLLRDDFAPEVMDRARSVIDRQSRHMARLLDDLLDVSRITSGKFELRKEPLDVREAVLAATESVAPLISARNVKLSLRNAQQPLMLDGDAARLQQVVANLLSNAAIHSRVGGSVEVRTRQVDGAAVVTVRDYGLGIEPHMLSRIFELFVQDEQRLDRPKGGLGVGLTLAKRIVEEHEGRIEAESEGRDKGSEFRVYLPLRPASSQAAGQTREGNGKYRRVVLVEDQVDAREMLRFVLEARGHQVMEAEDGKSGIALIERERPEVALVDVGLPGMSGYEVAREIRKNGALGRVHLVALTGYGTQADRQQALESGFDAHITKPADADTIDRALREAGGLADAE